MDRRIVVLTARCNTRNKFINKLKAKLKGIKVVDIPGIDIMDDITTMLDWNNKKDQSKVRRLADELYSAWEECDDKLHDKAIKTIDEHVGSKSLCIMGSVVAKSAKAKLEVYYPNQIVYFDIEDETTLELNLERLIDIKQLRLKHYIK
jgi:hypothetical protein